MPNIPLTNMAISLSGGGYRATTFHLGAMCLLDAIQLEAGNKLIGDEKRREKGVTLLENVRIISTISGGTLTGVMYALKLSQKGNFKDCYYRLYELLKDDKLVDHALDKLNSPGTWTNKYKNRNLINSFAEVYNEHFYGGATFGDLYNDLDSHLTDAIFGASEFTAGLQYRFLQSGSGEFGGGDLQLPIEVAERIRLADAAASSSCFPGGFEPMTMPTDFSNGPESRVEEWWRKKKINFEREATLAFYKANEAAVAAEEAASRDITLATSISETFKNFTAANEELKLVARKEKKAIKAHANASKALTEATEAAKDIALKKVDKTRTEVAEIRTAKVAAREAVELAAMEKSKVLQQHPKLAALLLATHEADLNAAAATAAAEDALTTAVKSVRSAERAANKASEKAQEDREKAELAQAAVRDSADLSAALKRAEKAATRAEKSAEAVNVTAAAVVETSADLALILAEKAVELTRRTQRVTTAVLPAKEKSTILKKAGSLASKAEKVAKESVAAAKAAKAAVVYAADQLNSCSYVISLAEDTSTQVASYKVNNPEATAYGELKTGMTKNRNMGVKAKSRSLSAKWTKGGPAKEGRNKTISDSTSLNPQIDTTANPTEKAIYEAAGDVTGTGMPGHNSQSPILLEHDISPANEAIATARKIEKEALLARKKAAVSAAEAVISVTEDTLAKVQYAAQRLLDKPAKFSEALTDAISAATKATAEAQKAEEKAVLARKEKPYHPTTAIMDGGILDNQGIRGVVMAEKRHSKDGKKPPFIGTYIISDVSGKTMSPYTFPGFTHSAFANFFTLKKINIATAILMAAILILLFFVTLPKWGIAVASVCLTILTLWLLAYLGIRSVFRARIASTFAGDDLPEIMKDLKVVINTPLATVLHLIVFRATSALKMITDIFLRQIRRLQIHGLYKSMSWKNRIVSNNIYELKGADQLTPELKKVIHAAINMPTTLWFSQNEKKEGALDDLIACGQLTLCSNLADYLKSLKKGSKREMVWNEVKDYHQEIDAVLEVLEHYWQNFRLDPYWMIRMYKDEQAEHEEQRRQRV